MIWNAVLMGLLFASAGNVNASNTNTDQDQKRAVRIDDSNFVDPDPFTSAILETSIHLLKKNSIQLVKLHKKLGQHDDVCSKIEELSDDVSDVCSKLEDHDEQICSKVDALTSASESCCEGTFSRLDGICSKIEDHDDQLCSKVDALTSASESCCEGTFSRLDGICSKIEDHDDQLCSKVDALTSASESCCEGTFSRLDGICSKIEDHDEQLCSKVDALTSASESCCEETLSRLDDVCSKIEDHDDQLCSKVDALTSANENCCEATFTRLDELEDNLCSKIESVDVKLDLLTESTLEGLVEIGIDLESICEKVLTTISLIDIHAESVHENLSDIDVMLEGVGSKVCVVESKLDEHDEQICSKFDSLTNTNESCCEETLSRLDDVCSKIEDHDDQLCSKVDALASASESCCEETLSLLDDICSKLDGCDEIFSQLDSICSKLDEHDDQVCSKVNDLASASEVCCEETLSRLDDVCSKIENLSDGTGSSCCPCIQLTAADVASGIVINSPGSYYLTEPVVNDGTSDTTITIDANDVILDLCGNRLSGGGESAITVSGGENITIRNGIIDSSEGVGGGPGIILSSSPTNVEICNIDFIALNRSLSIFGTNIFVRNCTFTGEEGEAINIDNSKLVHVESCTVFDSVTESMAGLINVSESSNVTFDTVEMCGNTLTNAETALIRFVFCLNCRVLKSSLSRNIMSGDGVFYCISMESNSADLLIKDSVFNENIDAAGSSVLCSIIHGGFNTRKLIVDECIINDNFFGVVSPASQFIGVNALGVNSCVKNSLIKNNRALSSMIGVVLRVGSVVTDTFVIDNSLLSNIASPTGIVLAQQRNIARSCIIKDNGLNHTLGVGISINDDDNEVFGNTVSGHLTGIDRVGGSNATVIINNNLAYNNGTNYVGVAAPNEVAVPPLTGVSYWVNVSR